MGKLSARTFLVLVVLAFVLCASWIVLAAVFVFNPAHTYSFLP